MKQNLMSNNLKAVLFPDDMQEQGQNAVLKEKCSTVQFFNYRCERSRNDVGIPYGQTNPMVMTFTVRLVQPEEGVLYHKRLMDNDPAGYTFLFNASFNEQQRLKSFENVLIVNGYLIDVEDDFSTDSQDKESSQMLIRVKLFVSSIIYKGQMKDELLEVSHG